MEVIYSAGLGLVPDEGVAYEHREILCHIAHVLGIGSSEEYLDSRDVSGVPVVNLSGCSRCV